MPSSASSTDTFSGDGRVLTDLTSGSDTAYSVAVQINGKIILAGVSDSGSNPCIALVRYNADGSLDTAFGNQGIVSTSVGALSFGKSVTVRADGKVLLAGYSNNVKSLSQGNFDFTLVQYNSDGSLDTGFGTGGWVRTDFGVSGADYATNVVQLASGNILVSGSGYDGIRLACYRSDGSLDASFGSDGKVVYALPQFVDTYDTTVLASGKIVVVGSNRYDHDFVVAEFNANGSIDSSFGNQGVAYTRFDMKEDGSTPLNYGRQDAAKALAVDATGRIVVAGNSSINFGADYVGRVVLARYLPNGSLDNTFSNDGLVITSFPEQLGLALQIRDMEILSDGKILVVGNTTEVFHHYSDQIVMLRYNADGSLDTSFGNGGYIIPTSPISDSIFVNGVKVIANGKYLVGGGNRSVVNGQSISGFFLAQYNADGTIDNRILNPTNIYGTAQNDTLRGYGGNDSIDGQGGTDTAVFSGRFSDYTITKTPTGFTVADSTGTDGTDTLINIERLQFSDKTIALDISGNGGQAYRLYQAAFARTPDNGGLKYWLNNMDSGMTLQQVSNGFLSSNEFKSVYGTNPSMDVFINKLYNNVLHRGPDQVGYSYWSNQITSGAQNYEQVLIGFSESNENQLNVIGVIQNGIELI